jgi:hypothetical protein
MHYLATNRNAEGESMKRHNPLGLKCDIITSSRRLVTTFLTLNSTEFE